MKRNARGLVFGVLIGLGLGFLGGRALYLGEGASRIDDLIERASPSESQGESYAGVEARRSPSAGDRDQGADAEAKNPSRAAEPTAAGNPSASGAEASRGDPDLQLMPVADPRAELVLQGLLLDPEGRAVANRSLRGELVSAQGRVGAFSETDDAGRFFWRHRGALPPEVKSFDLWIQDRPTGRFEVWTPPLMRARLAIDKPLRRGPQDIGTMRLQANRLLVRGRVRDEEGRPVAGAEIEVIVAPPGDSAGVLPGDGVRVGSFSDLTTQGLNLHSQGYDLKTDAEGRFELRRDAPAGEIKLRAQKAGLAPSRLVSVAAGTDGVDLNLLPGRTLRLRVRYRDGRAVGPLRFELKIDARVGWEPRASVVRAASELNLHYADLPEGSARFVLRDATQRVLHDDLVLIGEARGVEDVVLD